MFVSRRKYDDLQAANEAMAAELRDHAERAGGGS